MNAILGEIGIWSLTIAMVVFTLGIITYFIYGGVVTITVEIDFPWRKRRKTK